MPPVSSSKKAAENHRQPPGKMAPLSAPPPQQFQHHHTRQPRPDLHNDEEAEGKKDQEVVLLGDEVSLCKKGSRSTLVLPSVCRSRGALGVGLEACEGRFGRDPHPFQGYIPSFVLNTDQDPNLPPIIAHSLT